MAGSLARFGFTLPKSASDVSSQQKRKVSKDKYESEKRARKFVPSWAAQFPGIEDLGDRMVCTVCTKYPSQADNLFVKGCTTYRIDRLRTHWESPKHNQCLAADNVRENQGIGPLDRVIQVMGDRNKNALLALFNTAYTVMKYKMSFTSYPVMIELQIKNGGDLSAIQSYATDKACARFAPFIASAVREPLQAAVREANVISCMFDGATDCSISEVEIVYVRYLGNDGHPQDIFVGLEDVMHAHADGVFAALGSALSKFVGDDWHNKLIGAGCDGASVNLGVNNSVATRLKDSHPYLVTVHCIAHRLELGVMKAIGNHRMLETVQDLLKTLHKHYHYSPKQLRDLREVARVLDENIVKPTRLQGTRWLPHFQKASKALITGYHAIYAHFDHVSQAGPGEATAEVRGRAVFVAQKLRDFRVLRFIFFMQDLLAIVARLSLKFQQDRVGCADFLDSLETAALELVELGQEPGESYVAFMGEVQQDPVGTYKGTQLTYFDADNIPEYHFQNECDSVIQHLENRLENNNQDPSTLLLKAGRIFDTKEWPLTREDLARYGNADLAILTEHFQVVLVRVGAIIPQIPREWSVLKATLGRPVVNGRPRPHVHDLFIQHQNGDQRFLNILHLIEIVLVIPVSSSVCERGFSCLKRIKSDWRSSLSTAMMNHLMCASISGPGLAAYNAEMALNMWWEGGQRQRRPRFQAEQPDQEMDDLLQYILEHNQ